MIKIQFDAKFCTNGDYRFDNLESLIDPEAPLYKEVNIEYQASQDGYLIHIRLSVTGEANPCRRAIEDLLKNMFCNFHTIWSYLEREMYNFLAEAEVRVVLVTDRNIDWYDTIGGDYEGTYIRITNQSEEKETKI